ncbi:hypothetical protein BDV25DRAFT_138528 [Aspergillus avenaceus]|uniref:Uncharacterized protein n=1 Tax=Aspergillus avenaceus TaxID=36643 RepID=A0A5N6TZM1_ASPAV|nr:hypothetical protein BDV25DRAFT_138528 [Aspergillus avenaceus]
MEQQTQPEPQIKTEDTSNDPDGRNPLLHSNCRAGRAYRRWIHDIVTTLVPRLTTAQLRQLKEWPEEERDVHGFITNMGLVRQYVPWDSGDPSKPITDQLAREVLGYAISLADASRMMCQY